MTGRFLDKASARETGDQCQKRADEAEDPTEHTESHDDAIHAGLGCRNEESSGGAFTGTFFAQSGRNGNRAAGAEWQRNPDKNGFQNGPETGSAQVAFYLFRRKEKPDQSGHKETEKKPGGHRREHGPEAEDVIFDDIHSLFPFMPDITPVLLISSCSCS